MVAVSFIICGMLVYPIYKKWELQPTITAVEETDYPIWDVYFPAVAICNNNKIARGRMAEFLKGKIVNSTHYYSGPDESHPKSFESINVTEISGKTSEEIYKEGRFSNA